MGTYWKVGIQEDIDGGGREVLVKETDEGKFFIMKGGGSGFITQAQHGASTWGNNTTDARSRCGRGSTYHKFGVLTHDYKVGGVPSAMMPRNVPHHSSDEGKFHVQKLSLKGRGASGGEVSAAPLRHVQNAHDNR